MKTQRVADATAVLSTHLSPIEQIEVAEQILANHNSMLLTLTKRDATLRITERYNIDEPDARVIAEQFFATTMWQEKCEAETDRYWEIECGVETLFSPLDDWMIEQGQKKLDHSF